jgi:predicted Zn-dependent protease
MRRPSVFLGSSFLPNPARIQYGSNRWESHMSRMALLPFLAALLACGPSAESQLERARSHLAQGAYADAAVAANAGLAAGPEGPVAWRLELTALEAEARTGQAAEARARLERLAVEWPEQTQASLYVQTASQVREGGDATGAIDVLDAGAQRFPDDEGITRAISHLKARGTDAELERLRSLGYVE